ncbi:DUF6364 family protein [Mucilaginibacter flavus]|uniref:DUF6364 family protein n=1 Tax=Mucilaginibacter flavus TaxID=931504 RepID=UPI0025B2C510|nr:DUF6364 family protein [Mucilaginibacter flavus]MDN3583670.1 DUF6364 family protein [Mucilaginibacter flavus]
MKTKLNLTIEESLLADAKMYAQKQHRSVSQLVEDYFKSITKAPRRKNIIELVERLDPPAFDAQTDLKELYYQEHAKKYDI